MTINKTKITLGPSLFHYKPELKRDFYYKIADTPNIDVVYIGEIVCFKRSKLVAEYWDSIAKRLNESGKKVVYSTQILLTKERELEYMKHIADKWEKFSIEANDISCINYLDGKRYYIGPYVNVYNEKTFGFYANLGCTHLTFPFELDKNAIKILSDFNSTLSSPIEMEIQVFGRTPLAIASRCSHARAYNLKKKNCEYACTNDHCGLDVHTLDKNPFLAINGLQTMSYTYCNLINEVNETTDLGINYYRISPHIFDMSNIVNIFRNVLDKKILPKEGYIKLKELMPNLKFSNGFYEGVSGAEYEAV